MDEAIAHIIRNALPAAVSLLIAAQEQLRLRDLEGAEHSISLAVRRVRQAENAMAACLGPCCKMRKSSLKFWLREHVFYR